jgi:hypothetical protein
MSRIDSWHRKISTGRHFQNGNHNTAQIQHCSISTSWIDSRHRKISTGLHFQKGRHNTAKFQHCSISKVAFDLFFKPVVSGRFGSLHNRYIIIISYLNYYCVPELIAHHLPKCVPYTNHPEFLCTLSRITRIRGWDVLIMSTLWTNIVFYLCWY